MRKIIYFWLLFVCFVAIPYQNAWDFFHHKWAVLLGLGAFIIACEVYRKTDIWWALLTFWILTSAIYTFQWMNDHYYQAGLRGHAKILLGYYSVTATCCFLFLFSIIRGFEKHMEKIKLFFVLLCFIDSIYVLSQWAIGNHFLWRGGFFCNGSINGCFIAILLPLLLDYLVKNYKIKFIILIMAIPIAAIFCTLTSVPVGTLAVALSAYFFLSLKNKYYRALVVLSVIVGIFLIGYNLDPTNFFDDTKRLAFYQLTWEDFINRGPVLFGTGTGTFTFFGIATQLAHKFRIGAWHLWLHNDWLQYLTENGFIGLSLALCATTSLLRRCWHRPAICASIWAYLACMVFNYPLHYPMHALYAMFIIRYCYMDDTITMNK